MSRGAMIVFEGLDRSGKSTQAKNLLNYLNENGGKAELFPFPDRSSPFGKLIDRYLRKEIDLNEQALHLAFSADRWEKSSIIRQKIAEGVTVICDRYCFSGVSYSLAKGMHADWVRRADVGLPRPDVVLFFEVSPEVARERGGFGDERLENEELQRKVRDHMRSLKKDYWTVIDADKSQDEVGAVVREVVSKLDVSQSLGVVEEVDLKGPEPEQ